MIKVLTYNIHKGFNFSGRRLVISQIKEMLTKHCTDWDLIFLQEVVGEHSRHASRFSDWPLHSQHEFLAAGAWQHTAYGQNKTHRFGNHGNSILSNWEILSHFNQNISTSRFEKRGILHTQLTLQDTQLWASCAHLDLSRWGQRIQLNKLATWVKESVPADAPLILAGDFNDRTGASTHYLRRALDLEDATFMHTKLPIPSFPSFLPLMALDRIYIRGFKVIEAGVLSGYPWDKLSDHLPVYAFLELDR